RSLNRTPLFQVLFALQNAPFQSQRLGGLQVDPIPAADMPLRVRFDLDVHAREQGDELHFIWMYNRGLFDDWRIEQMARDYIGLLRAVCENPSIPVGHIRLESSSAALRLLKENKRAERLYPAATISELFERQVERTPQAPAVAYEGFQWTFDELNQRANQLARDLIPRIGPEKVVGLYLRRGPDLIAALLAVLKAGGAYLPLDPALPKFRLDQIASDAGCALVLTESALSRSAPGEPAELMFLDANQERWAENSSGNLATGSGAKCGNAAYVIYTSGSTGKPKGVIVEHRQIANYVAAVQEAIDFPPGARFGLMQSLAFDFAATILFTSLCYGGCLHLISEEASTDPALLASYVQRERLDCFKIAPSHMAALQNVSDWERLLPSKRLILGGEACRWAWVDALREKTPGCAVFNHYGPTETTVGVLTYRVENGAEYPAAMLPVGRPLAHSTAYILDTALQPSPPGVAGELYIAGAGVARGYLKRPAVTAGRFVADPFGRPGTRMYRTGDLMRQRRDGAIEFLGRNDFQLKIRGFRIEPGEIEARLAEHPDVAQALVSAREDEPGEKRLVAYYTCRNSAAPAVPTGELRAFVLAKLPEYMAPAAYVHLDSFPLAPNGKLLRSALPTPAAGAYPAGGYQAPEGEIEETLAEIWGSVLNLEQVGRNANFFALGGHSLLAVRIIARVRQALNVEVKIADLFARPVLCDLADQILNAQLEQFEASDLLRALKEM
ncbi:MAG TPA: amino acid adenylation domain-containing protein, partial [Bryobacteraceae bacterium]|nr:amino acid adenylation domain-containing protein [Bryobacteraceae bacterium]